MSTTLRSQSVREPNAREFRELSSLIESVSGIVLHETKRPLLVRRLSARIRELSLTSYGEYYRFVIADSSGEELVRMLDLVATNETQFFREPGHFRFLEEHVYPAWQRMARLDARRYDIRVWSAACSTGQEPFSLAMQFLAHLPPEDGWRTDILATDISTRALAVATSATWNIEKATQIPARYLKAFMLRGTDDQIGKMRATPALREAVRFERFNLSDGEYPRGVFDVIFCRNVLIYFAEEARATVIERLTDALVPNGLLFVGHAESLHSHRTRLRALQPTIYMRTDT
jgi:chemotaxis protein methyltransferase CheR